MAPEKPQYLSWKALRWLHPNAAAWQGSSARCAHGSPCSEYAPEFTAKVKESESEAAQSCPTLCNPMDCSLPGSSIHGILQARILEWVAIPFSRGSSPPRDRTQVSCNHLRHQRSPKGTRMGLESMHAENNGVVHHQKHSATLTHFP